MDRRWPAFPRSELSGEEWTDCLASIRPVGITVFGPFDSGIDRLWSASFLIFRSLIAKGLNFAENGVRTAPCAMPRSRIDQESLPAKTAFAVADPAYLVSLGAGGCSSRATQTCRKDSVSKLAFRMPL